MVEVTDTSNARFKDGKSGLLDSSDDEDDVPLVNLLKKTKDKKPLLSLDSSDDEDDVPLVNLLKKTKDQKQSEQTAGQSLSSEGQTQDDAPDSSDDEDDVPLVNLLKKTKDQKQSEQTAVDSSDEELLSIVAKSAQAKKAAANQNQSRSIHVGKRTAALDSSDEDDVPLVNLLKKIKDKQQSAQTAGQTLSSEAPQTQHDDDSSDDEPLSTFKKTGPSKKEAANHLEMKSSRRTYIRTESSDGSSDDDVPLVNWIRKENQSTTKTKTRSTPAQRSTSKPTTRAPRMHAESSDDEPLINLLKKSLKDTTNTTLPQGNGKRTRKRGETPWNNNQGPSGKTTVTKKKKKRQRAGNNGLSSDSSDDEPLVKITKGPQVTTKGPQVTTKGPQVTTKGPQVTTKGPQVTMLLKVMVERCRV